MAIIDETNIVNDLEHVRIGGCQEEILSDSEQQKSEELEKKINDLSEVIRLKLNIPHQPRFYWHIFSKEVLEFMPQSQKEVVIIENWQEIVSKWEGRIRHKEKVLLFLENLNVNLLMLLTIIRHDFDKYIQHLNDKIDYLQEQLNISRNNENAFIKRVHDRFALICDVFESSNIDMGECFVKMLRQELKYKD